ILRVSQRTADANGRKFVLADAAEEDFLHTSLSVEVPRIASALQRNREGPVLRADNQRLFAVDLLHPAMHLLVAFGEEVAVVLVLDFITGGEDAGRRRAKNGLDSSNVAGLRRVVERLSRVLRIGVGFLPGLLGDSDSC